MHWLVVALVVALFVVAPLILPRQHVDVLVFAGIYAIAGLGVGLLLGQCGIVNLAMAVFYGIGAYASAWATVTQGLPVAAGFAIGIAISAGVALAIGWPILRLTGFFLAVATLGVGLIGSTLFYEWDGITGGTLGIGGLPSISIAGFDFNTPVRFYFLVWTVAALLIWSAWNLTRGKIGLAMRAMRDAAPAAAVLGVDMHRLKVQVFVLCAALGSLAGSLFAHYASYVSVSSFSVERSILFLLIPVIGGAHSVPGVLLGALFVTLVPEMLSGFGDAHHMLFGTALVLSVILLPKGLAGLVSRLSGRKEIHS